MGFIVHKALLDTKPQPILLTGVHLRRFITDHRPPVVARPRSSYGQLHRPKALVGEIDLRPASGVSPGSTEACALAAATPRAREPICAAAHICSYVEFRNMWSMLPYRRQ
jgi:hypothetical protein